ncbi:MAG: hypothetical protein HY270_07145 [Deltaproteobacteria bacterium]|nr:hypothetical protein [Deltaproteobacteria bacterium]
MHDDHRDGGDGHDHEHEHDHGHDGERCEQDGGGDTRGLQLEMSQVLHSEAESVTREAFRQLLLDAAKERWRERFGDKITALANLAVDELMEDMLYSLDVERRIQQRNEDRADPNDQLHAIFADSGASERERPKSSDGNRQGRKGAARRRGRR